MIRFLITRTISSIVVLYLVATMTFFLVLIAPGGVSVLMDPNLPVAEVQRLERILGVDRPPVEQYAAWLRNLVRGDLGRSLTYGGRPVVDMVVERVPATLTLGLTAFAIAVVFGVPLGIYSARHQNTLSDQVVSLLSFVGLATPNFWLGILLIIVFAVKLKWLPTGGIGTGSDLGTRLQHLVLPALVLGTSSMAAIVRYTRSSWLEMVNLDFVRTARSKGLSDGRVDRRHILKNAMIPVITIMGVQLPRIVGGSAVVETLFGWPGMGQLAVDAALRRDTPLILGVTILISVGVILSNLVVDMLYPLLDPRIRYA